jgi:hypothetical protein
LLRQLRRGTGLSSRDHGLKALAADRAVVQICLLAHVVRCIRRALSLVDPAALVDPVEDPASVVLVELDPASVHVPDSADLVREEERLDYCLREEERLRLDVRWDAPHSVVEVARATRSPKKAR